MQKKSWFKSVLTAFLMMATTIIEASVAKIGPVEYDSLDAAISALNSKEDILELVDSSVWNESTPVWCNGNFYGTLLAALNAQETLGEDIKIVCRPGANVGSMTHGPVYDNLTVWGNKAYVSAGERDFNPLADKDITLNIYSLDKSAAWGERKTASTVTYNFYDCKDMDRVYVTGTAGENIGLFENCSFSLRKNCSFKFDTVTTLKFDGCAFDAISEAINVKLDKNAAAITVKNCTFTDCGLGTANDAAYSAPIRVVNNTVEGSGTAQTVAVTVENCAFIYSDGNASCNGDILLGDGRANKTSDNITLTISGTAATIQFQKPGYQVAKEPELLRTATVAAGQTLSTSIDAQFAAAEEVAEVGGESFASVAAAVEAAVTVAGENGTAEITVSAGAAASATITEFVSAVASASANARINLTVPTAKGTVSFNGAAVVGINAKKEDGAAVAVTVEETAAPAGVTVSENAKVYDISLTGAAVTEAAGGFGTGGEATITLPVPAGILNPAIYYIAGAAKTLVKSTVADGKISFKTTHLSTYAVDEGAPASVAFIDANGNNALDDGETGYESIQAAVNAAANGDVIVVLPGRTEEFVCFYGKSLTFKAQYPAYNPAHTLEADESKLSQFAGTFYTNDGNDVNGVFAPNQTVVIDGFDFVGTGVKIGANPYATVGRLEVRNCAMKVFEGKRTVSISDRFPLNRYESNNFIYNNAGVWFNAGGGMMTEAAHAVYVIENNYICAEPAGVYPMQIWGVAAATVRDNVIDFKKDVDITAINITKPTKDAVIEVSGNEIKGATKCAIQIANWMVYDGQTENVWTTPFSGTVRVVDNTITYYGDNAVSRKGAILVGNTNAGDATYTDISANAVIYDIGNTEKGEPVSVIIKKSENGPAVSAAIDFAEFERRVIAGNGTYDGNGVTVKWSSVGGCFDSAKCWLSDTHVKNNDIGNTPDRVNSDLAQYHVFGALDNVNVSNVKFVFVPADFFICRNSGWKGTFTASQAPAAQIYCQNPGAMTFSDCTFDHVVLTHFADGAGTGAAVATASTVTDCTFRNIYKSYAVKDIRGATMSVTGCTFENCGGGIMLSQKDSTTSVTSIAITGNTFNNVDNSTEWTSGVGKCGLVQIASSGNYNGATLTMTGNTITNCENTKTFRHLNESASTGAKLVTDIANVTYITSDSTHYETFSKPVARIGSMEYASLAAAVADAADGATITVLPNVTITEYVAPMAGDSSHAKEKSITIIGPEDKSAVLTGGMYIGYDDSNTRANTITIKNLTFEVNGLTVADEETVVIENCVFQNITGHATDSGTAGANAITVLDQKTAKGGASVSGSLTITGCEIDGVEEVGIRVRNPMAVSITGNTIANTKHNAILFETNDSWVANGGAIVVSNNVISNWDADNDKQGGRAVRVSLGAGTVEKSLTFTGNVMTKTNWADKPEDPNFVKITYELSGVTADLSGNYWNSEEPDFSVILNGSTFAGEETTVVKNYYSDATKETLKTLGTVSVPTMLPYSDSPKASCWWQFEPTKSYAAGTAWNQSRGEIYEIQIKDSYETLAVGDLTTLDGEEYEVEGVWSAAQGETEEEKAQVRCTVLFHKDNANPKVRVLIIAGNGSGAIKLPANAKDFFSGNNNTVAFCFNRVASISGLELLDTSDVTDMSRMFRHMKSLKSIDLSGWDTSNVTTMSEMFYYCDSLTDVTFGTEIDTSKVTDMSSMFQNAVRLTNVDVENLDTSSVTTMASMFSCSHVDGGNKAMRHLDVSTWDTSKVKNFTSTFSSLPLLEALDVSGFDTSSATTMERMFYNCQTISEFDFSNWDVSHVTNMKKMFSYVKNVETLDLSNWDTSNVTTMEDMFKYNSKSGKHQLKTIYVSDKFVVPDEPNDEMFKDCESLVGGYGTQYSADLMGASSAQVDGAATPSFFTMKYVARIGETKYATLLEAIEAAEEGQTVTMLADSDETETWLTGISITKAITVDGAGHTVKVGKGTGYAMSMSNADAKIKNLTFDLTSGMSGVSMSAGTLDGVTMLGDSAARSNWGVYVYGDITVKDCVFENMITAIATDEETGANKWYITVDGCTIKGADYAIIARGYESFINNTVFGGKINVVSGDIAAFTGNTIKAGNSVKFYASEYVADTSKNTFESAADIVMDSGAAVDLSGNYWGGEEPAGLPEGVTVTSYYNNVDMADDHLVLILTDYVMVSGIVGFEGRKFATINAAYDAISAFVSEQIGLVQEPANVEKFNSVFTANGEITWTIYGKQVLDETGRPYIVSFGRKASHFGTAVDGCSLHITKINIVGGHGDKSDKLTFATDASYPYEWWSSDCPSIAVEVKNLTLESTNGEQKKICFYQSFNYAFDLTYENCNVNGFLYFYNNASGSVAMKNNVFTGDGNITYATHIQGHETQPLTIVFTGNTVSGYKRGINIDQITADATIANNTITPGIGYSAIQLSGVKTATITGNTINDQGNFLTFHENLAKNAVEGRIITVTGNTVNAVDGVQGYLIYDDIKVEADKGNYEDKAYFTFVWGDDNTVAESIITDSGVKGSSVYGLTEYVDGVINPRPVAQIGETVYYSLTAANAAAQSGDTVELLADALAVSCGCGETFHFKSGVTYVGKTDASGKPATVFNTTFASNGTYVIDAGAVIENIKFNVLSTGADAGTVFAAFNAFTMDNCEVVFDEGMDTSGYVFDMAANESVVTITNCTFTDNTTTSEPTRVVGFNYATRYTTTAKFTFTGNTVTGRWSNGVIELLAGSYEVKNNTVTITGDPDTVFSVAVTPNAAEGTAYNSVVFGNTVDYTAEKTVFLRYIPIDGANQSTTPTLVDLWDSIKPDITGGNTVTRGGAEVPRTDLYNVCKWRAHKSRAKIRSITAPFGADVPYKKTTQRATGFVPYASGLLFIFPASGAGAAAAQ